MNGLDYVLLLWLALSALAGYKRGLTAVLGGLASTLAALAVAFLYRDELTLYLEKEFNLQTLLVQQMAEKLPQPALGGSALDKLLPSLQSLPLVQDRMNELAYLILTAVAFILLYIAVSFGLKLIMKLLAMPFKHGALGFVNRLAGTAFTVGRDVLVMAVLLGILYPFIHSGAAMSIKGLMKAGALIDNSLLAPYLNIIFISLEKLLGIGV
ncbi:MAG TPA: CvpA family protein [Syntrophomonas sp.]|nr:CvpA family protein [Syntrophomonas sp.]